MPAGTRAGQVADPLVSTDWLAQHLDDPSVRILDCRYYFDDPGRGERAYREAHIPGALYMDWTQAISEPRGNLKLMAPSAAHLTASLERLGISNETTVVGYDDEGGHYVSRLWIIMRHFGLNTVRMLNGGWTRWVRENSPTRAGEESPPAPGRIQVKSENEEQVLVDASEVLRRRDDPNTILLDVRRWTEFTGEEVRSKHGGRIPWAHWMLWQDNLRWDEDRSFRTDEEIRQRYEEAGLTQDTKIITYCHGGVRAAHTAFALGRLGYGNVEVYDGSWEEWGDRDDLPIATGNP